MSKNPKVKFIIGAKSGSSDSLANIQSNNLITNENEKEYEENRSPNSPDSNSKSDLIIRFDLNITILLLYLKYF